MEAENPDSSSTAASCSSTDLARSLRDAQAEIGVALGGALATVSSHLRQVERLRKTIPGRAIQHDRDHIVHDLFTAREQMRSMAAKLKRAARIADALGATDRRARTRARTSSRKTQCAGITEQS